MYDRIRDPSQWYASTLRQAEHKFGAAPDVDTALATIWDYSATTKLYPWASLATAQALEIVSTEAVDNGETPNTGARTVTVYGCDANYALQQETVTLNGLGVVDLSNEYLRVWRMVVETAGSGGTNAGAINLQLDDAGQVVAQILAGNAQTLMAIYTVPTGYQAFLTSWGASMEEGKDCTLKLFIRPFGGAWNIKDEASLYQASGAWAYDDPLPIAAKSDIDLRAISANVNTEVKGWFHLRLGQI